jgi:hypothetical protein
MPYLSTRCGGDIIIGDASRDSSSTSIKREATVKKEAHSPPRGRLHLSRRGAPLLPPVLLLPPLQLEKKW